MWEGICLTCIEIFENHFHCTLFHFYCKYVAMLQLLLDQQVDAGSNVLTITIVVGALVAILILYLSFSSSDSKKSKTDEKPVEEKPVEKPKAGITFVCM